MFEGLLAKKKKKKMMMMMMMMVMNIFSSAILSPSRPTRIMSVEFYQVARKMHIFFASYNFATV